MDKSDRKVITVNVDIPDEKLNWLVDKASTMGIRADVLLSAIVNEALSEEMLRDQEKPEPFEEDEEQDV